MTGWLVAVALGVGRVGLHVPEQRFEVSYASLISSRDGSVTVISSDAVPRAGARTALIVRESGGVSIRVTKPRDEVVGIDKHGDLVVSNGFASRYAVIRKDGREWMGSGRLQVFGDLTIGKHDVQLISGAFTGVVPYEEAFNLRPFPDDPAVVGVKGHSLGELRILSGPLLRRLTIVPLRYKVGP